ncbi:MAG TPA: prepilin-type N-terminal cleavage/methylation domain-containing protein [Bryobacteraceae bacterium]|jgi:general secretion pathway protein J
MARRTRGFTLIEMMIAVTLVAAIITGLLMAMRTGLSAYEKVNRRLEDNRRAMGLDQTLHRQFGGIIPAAGYCGLDGPKIAAFNGDAASVRFVSSASLAEGSRGLPRVVEYVAAADPNGGTRLMMNERIYAGPSSVAPQCVSGILPPVQVTPESVEMAGKLAYCRFAYRVPVPDSPVGAEWLPTWQRPDLPRAVRVEMMPLDPNPSHLPMLTLNVPIHITRLVVTGVYADQ